MGHGTVVNPSWATGFSYDEWGMIVHPEDLCVLVTFG
jgi:hypothetical protein